MRTKDRQKICTHCEGRISVEADTCLYCGMPLVGGKPEEKPIDIMSTLQGGAPPLYPPLYASAKKESSTEAQASILQEDRSSVEQEDEKAGLVSILMALAGSTLFILGLMQGFFAEGDTLKLEWNCHYWFLYLVLAAPLLYLSIRNRSSNK